MPTIFVLDQPVLDPVKRAKPVDIPEGWRRVWRGRVKPGDLYLNALLFNCDGITEWRPVTDLDENATRYQCLIRQGTPGPDKTCERCGAWRARTGWRFCEWCADIIRDQHAEAESCP